MQSKQLGHNELTLYSVKKTDLLFQGYDVQMHFDDLLWFVRDHNSLWPSDDIWWLVTWIWVKIGSGDGMVPDGIKPLHKPVLISDEVL